VPAFRLRGISRFLLLTVSCYGVCGRETEKKIQRAMILNDCVSLFMEMGSYIFSLFMVCLKVSDVLLLENWVKSFL
jgi:hypothetical protein